MLKNTIAKKAYKLSNENSDEVMKNSQRIDVLADQISSIHTHTHANKTILDQTTASYLSEEKQKLSLIENGANKNVQADWNEEDSTKDAFINNKPSIPSKTSELTNDSGFITSSSVPTKTSDLTNDSGYITSSDIPTNVSSFTNDSGYVTANDVSSAIGNKAVRYDTSSQNLTSTQKQNARTNIGAGTSNFSGSYTDLANKPTIPTKTSDLTNDSGFITASSLPTKTSDLTNDSGYITSSDIPTDVSAFNNDSGYITSSDIPTNLSDFTNDCGFITNSANDLTNYYKKSETYTQTEVNSTFVPQTRTVNGKSLSANISLSYSDVGALPSNTTYVQSVNGQSGVITGLAESGDIPTEPSDIGAEPAFTKNTAFNKNFETTATNIKENGTQSVGVLSTVARADHTHPHDSTKQNKITSTNKLNADLVDDSSSTHKFVSASEKTQIATNATNITNLSSTKQDVFSSSNKLNADYIDDSTSIKKLVSSNEKVVWDAKQNALSSTQLAAVNSGINTSLVTQIATNVTNISKKVPKTDSPSKIYGTDSSGNQYTYNLANASNAPLAVAQYSSSCTLKSATPSANDDVANKSYVDGIDTNLQTQISGKSMKPSDNTVTYSTSPTAGATLMTAPTNGVAYVRFALWGSGGIGLHLQTSAGNDLVYNTQYFPISGFNLYCATFVMKAGQKLYCYENSLAYDWGSIVFVKSED